ncbi:MAG TPA: LPS assembly lipoprotein LptE [Burkholderiaceae bacterium]|jgi:LPS-assembly lipoprotein|nr:LPS assembly lipoprotein LptE [Burkholderiaceae bacterium]
MKRRILLQGLAASLAGCGFELRRPPELHFKSIALTGFAPRSTMAEALRDALREAQVVILEDPAQAQLTLEALTDASEKSVVASTAAGQVREVQLRQKLNFRVRTATGRELIPATELLLTRDMSYSETIALAKEQEEALLFRGMRGDIVQQLLRRLATLTPS